MVQWGEWEIWGKLVSSAQDACANSCAEYDAVELTFTLICIVLILMIVLLGWCMRDTPDKPEEKEDDC